MFLSSLSFYDPYASWRTKQGVTITINEEFTRTYSYSLTDTFSIDTSLTVAYYGKAALPFFAAVIFGIFSDNIWLYSLAILLCGIGSIINLFTIDDPVTLFLKYVFTYLSLFSFRLAFFVPPVIFYFTRGVLFSLLYFGVFFILWFLYLIADQVCRDHTKAKYELKKELSLFDVKCLKKVYTASRKRYSFVSFVEQYKYEVEEYQIEKSTKFETTIPCPNCRRSILIHSTTFVCPYCNEQSTIRF